MAMAIVIAGTLLIPPVNLAFSIIKIATTAGTTIDFTDYFYAKGILNNCIQGATKTPGLEELKLVINSRDLPQIGTMIIPTSELSRKALG